MGRAKKERGYNWEARKVVQTDIDNSATSKIKLDLKDASKGSYDHSNLLVIPSEKRKTKKKKESTTVTKLLSKRHRKRLEKIVDLKAKKEKRAGLLESLSKVQAPADLFKHMISIAAMQTKGLKRHFSQVERGDEDVRVSEEPENPRTVNSISGSRKRKRLLALKRDDKEEVEKNPNIVGFESSSDDSSGEDESQNLDTEMDTAAENDAGNGVKSDGDEDNENPITDQIAVDDSGIEKSIDNTCDSVDKPVDQSAQTENITNTNSTNIEKTISPKLDPADSKPAVFVTVNRRKDIQTSRMKLPILAEEQVIMETINENPVVVLAGETGSGKTTQVPQFLYEAGYATNGQLIGVTEPRRVAAISMAARVADEMNLSNREVSYLIRFEGNVTEDTKIKFMTDGVLLKEIQSDFLLSKYSVIILDEAHERSVYTDILIGLLSRIVPLRNKRGKSLKLIIMSATLRLEDFTTNTRLFKIPPPVIKVESRQFPVTIHFNKRTSPDYMKEAYDKACKIHTQLPEGGILIFLTGQHEVNSVVKKLRKSFPLTNKSKKTMSEDDEEDVEESLKQELKKSRKSRRKQDSEVKLPEINLDNYCVEPNDDTEMELLGDDDDDDFLDDETNITKVTNGKPMWVLPLYSLLPSHRQAKVFKAPPTGCRLCIVATNVAETSLTIPGIKYVIDSGRVKSRLYDKVTGVSAFHVTWSSKAGANQRAGRAGRTSAGHCYRLFSSAVFNDQFEDFTKPEIQRKPVDDLLLQMKSMNIIKVVNFPFPSAPDHVQLKFAEQRLQLLGALIQPAQGEDEWGSRISSLGMAISAFPVSPRYGKMLALSYQHDLLPYTVCMVAALSVQEVLQEVPVKSDVGDQSKRSRTEWAKTRRHWAGTGQSLLLGDPMVLLRAVGAAEYAGISGNLETFCLDNGLRFKAITEIRKLRLQLTTEINLNLPELNLCVDPRMKPPTDEQARQLRQILLAGSADLVAYRVALEEIKESVDRAKWKHAYRCGEMEDPVVMHSGSVLRKSRPEWVVYQEVFETDKLIMRGITAIEPEWLPIFAKSMCHLSEPQAEPEPRFDTDSGKMYCCVRGTYGKAAWPVPSTEIEFPSGIYCYKWFARFLLDGSVCPKLKMFKASLLSTPATMVKSWANLQPRTTLLLNALMDKQVDSKEKLLQVWKTETQYLLNAFQKWLPESAHTEVALIWPPV